MKAGIFNVLRDIRVENVPDPKLLPDVLSGALDPSPVFDLTLPLS